MNFFSAQETLTITLTLFAMIDILGAIPIILVMRQKVTHIDSGKATVAAGGLMVLFLLLGEQLLNLFGIDVSSFALAGSIVIFIIAFAFRNSKDGTYKKFGVTINVKKDLEDAN
jgi:multiple antibiotic resistance protein